MVKRILGIDTASDDLTQACLDVREARVSPTLSGLGLNVDRLTGAAATKGPTLAALTSEVTYVSGCGHGVADGLIGQSDTILGVGQYPPAAVAGKIVHLLACNCGTQLGPDLVANGCLAFFGYTEEFLFPASSPGDFLECDGAIDISIAEGLTAEETFQVVMNAFNRRIAALRAAGDNFRASLVEHNCNCLAAPTRDPKWDKPDATA